MEPLLTYKHVGRILQLHLEGRDDANISQALALPCETVRAVLEKYRRDPESMAILAKGKRKYKQIPESQRIKGYIAARRAYYRNRSAEMKRLQRRVLGGDRAALVATIAYYLAQGSRKEFSVAARNADIGRMYLASLRSIGIPAEAIRLEWRHCDPSSLPDEWHHLRDFIVFSSAPGPRSMRLRVHRCTLADGMRVSSSALGKCFYSIGQSMVRRVGKTDQP